MKKTLFFLSILFALAISLLMPFKVYAADSQMPEAAQKGAAATQTATVKGGEIKFNETDDDGFFAAYINKISGSVYNEATSWVPSLKNAATALFACLMAISFAWTCIEIALRQGGVGEIFAEVAKSAIFFGLFFFALKNVDAIAGVIFNTFTSLTSPDDPNMGGPQAGNVASITINLGLNYMETTCETIWLTLKTVGVTNIVPAIKSVPFVLMALVLGLFIFFVCALICIKLLVAEATIWILMYGGIFILGFGGSKWTKDIAITYFKTVIAMCFSFFGMLMLAYILAHQLSDVTQAMYARFNAVYNASQNNALSIENLPGCFDMLVEASVVLIMYFLIDKIPQLFSGMINGMHFTAGPASFAAAGAAMSAGAAHVMGTKDPKTGIRSGGLAGAVKGTVKAAGASIKETYQAAKSTLTGGAKTANALYQGAKSVVNGGMVDGAIDMAGKAAAGAGKAVKAAASGLRSAGTAIYNEAESWRAGTGYEYTNKHAQKMQSKDSEAERSDNLNDYKPGGARYKAMNGQKGSSAAVKAEKESESKSEEQGPANETKSQTAGNGQKPNESYETSGQSQAQTAAGNQKRNAKPSDEIYEAKEGVDYEIHQSQPSERVQDADNGQKPNEPSEQAQTQPQTGYYDHLDKEIAANAEQTAQESSKNTFTAADVSRYDNVYDARKDFPNLSMNDWLDAKEEAREEARKKKLKKFDSK